MGLGTSCFVGQAFSRGLMSPKVTGQNCSAPENRAVLHHNVGSCVLCTPLPPPLVAWAIPGGGTQERHPELNWPNTLLQESPGRPEPEGRCTLLPCLLCKQA